MTTDAERWPLWSVTWEGAGVYFVRESAFQSREDCYEWAMDDLPSPEPGARTERTLTMIARRVREREDGTRELGPELGRWRVRLWWDGDGSDITELDPIPTELATVIAVEVASW